MAAATGRQIARALGTWTRRRWWIVLIAVGVILLFSVGVVLSVFQLSQTAPLMLDADALPAGDMRLERQREIVQLQSDNLSKIWTTIVQAVVGVVLAVGAVATWRNLRVAQEGQITNRFTQAIDQLGAMKDKEPNIEVRLGGIYALERIARDSPRDHWTIMEVLTAYVRENARWSPPSSIEADIVRSEGVVDAHERPLLHTDVQAILTVLGRRDVSYDQPLAMEDIPSTDAGKQLDLDDTFRRERLDLHLTDLRRARLVNARLEGAYLNGANLVGANLRGAHLESALLWDADLQHAYLSGTSFKGAHLDRADLSTAKGLTEDQVKSTRSRLGARLPVHLTHLAEPDSAVTESSPLVPVPPDSSI